MAMKMYERNIMVNILESKILDSYEEYYPQGQYNNMFIKYLYKYIRDNTYSGEHDELLRDLIKLKNDPLFKNTKVEELVDSKTYVITDDSGITSDMYTKISQVLRKYYNYKYTIISQNRIEIEVKFGWLPPNTSSWLNLINEECLIDYYIDGITLKKNTHSILGNGKPDSGFVCYKIDGVKEYNTIMFISDKSDLSVDNTFLPSGFKVASLLEEIEGSKGATLNRIVSFDLDDFFYEVGRYNQNYLTTEKSSLIIQVPYEYAISDMYYLYDVSNAVVINNENDKNNPNSVDNYFVSFNNPNYDSMFKENKIKHKSIDVNGIVITYNGNEFVAPDRNIISKTIKIISTASGTTFTDDGKGSIIDNETGAIVGSVDYKTATFILDKSYIPENSNMSYKYTMLNIADIILSSKNLFDTVLQQYLLGDFIWKTSDSKLIAYLQNLINALYNNSGLVSSGVWSDKLSLFVAKYKSNSDNLSSIIFDDDVVDKNTEELMLSEYRLITNLDPNEELFNEW